MQSDDTVEIRQKLAEMINVLPGTREELELVHGQVWDPEQLQEQFEVQGFATPLVVVKRRQDEQIGSLFFQASPRFYFGWKADHG